MSDHVIIVKAETEEAEAETTVLHPEECVSGYTREGVKYSCGIDHEISENGLCVFNLDDTKSGIYLVDLEYVMHTAGDFWNEVDIEASVVELGSVEDREEVAKTAFERWQDAERLGK